MSTKVQNSTLVGSIVSAVLASICCIGPIIFATFGIGGAGLVLKFEEYRPLFIVIAVALLGTAGYFVYRKKPGKECAPDSFCANPRSGRINKIIFWGAAILVAVSIFIPTLLGWLV